MKWVKYFIGILILGSLVWGFYSTNQRVILGGATFNITEKDMLKAKKGFDNNVTDQQVLAMLFEEKFNDLLIKELNIDSSDEAKIIYFNKYHPDTVSKENFNNIKSSSEGLLKSLEALRDNKLNIDEAYDQYMQNYMSKEDWMRWIKKIDKIEVIKSMKLKLKKTYTSFSKEALNSLKDIYSRETISEKICKLEEVNKILEKYIAEINKRLFRSADHTDSLVKNLRKTRCKEESKIWLKSYLEKNYQLIDEKYLGFEKYLSFN